MAIIPQKKIFGWEEVEQLGDLERLRLVLQHMPDEELMRELEKDRGHGRDDYPVRGMWNAILAGIVYEHNSVASLIRELSRNGQLRFMCGLEGVPTCSAFSRFLKTLLSKEEEINAIFDKLVKELIERLPDFGKILAVDGKAIETHARPNKKEKADGRRDTDANFGKKVYKGKREDGTTWEKVVSWFGYKVHLLIDANYELPVAYTVTKASEAEIPQAHKLIDQLEKTHPDILERCAYLTADRGYDDGKLITKVWDQYEIKPIIDIRNMWKDGEETKVVKGMKNVVYNYRGTVYCYCPETGKRREMAYGGLEKDRETLKYHCPAEHYCSQSCCPGGKNCPVQKSVRIPLTEDRRVFTPVARSSYKWDTLYKKRPAVERVNSRLDVSFGFENHYIKGQSKMTLRMGMALCVMLAMAVGRIKENQKDKMRSLVQAV